MHAADDDQHDKAGDDEHEPDAQDTDPVRREEREADAELAERVLIRAEISAWGHP